MKAPTILQAHSEGTPELRSESYLGGPYLEIPKSRPSPCRALSAPRLEFEARDRVKAGTDVMKPDSCSLLGLGVGGDWFRNLEIGIREPQGKLLSPASPYINLVWSSMLHILSTVNVGPVHEGQSQDESRVRPWSLSGMGLLTGPWPKTNLSEALHSCLE